MTENWIRYLSSQIASLYKFNYALFSLQEVPKQTIYLYLYLHRDFVAVIKQPKRHFATKITMNDYRIESKIIKDDRYVLVVTYNLYWEWIKWKYEHYDVALNIYDNWDQYVDFFIHKVYGDIHYRFNYYIKFNAFPMQNPIEFFCSSDNPTLIATNVSADSYLFLREGKVFDKSMMYYANKDVIKTTSHKTRKEFLINEDQNINAITANSLIQQDLIRRFIDREIDAMEQNAIIEREKAMAITDVSDVRDWWWCHYNDLDLEYLDFLHPTTIFWKKFLQHIDVLRRLFNQPLCDVYDRFDEVWKHFHDSIVSPYKESHNINLSDAILNAYPLSSCGFPMQFASMIRFGVLVIDYSVYATLDNHIPKLFEDLRAFRKFILPYKKNKNRMSALIQPKSENQDACICTLLVDGCDPFDIEELLRRNVFPEADIVVF